MCRAHQSRPAPPTDRNRRAFPIGKARSGCAASLPPPLCTAVRRLARRDPPTAVVAAGGRQSTSPSHWSSLGSRSGRSSAALKRGSACGDCTAPVLSRSTTHTQQPIGATTRSMGAHGERCTGGRAGRTRAADAKGPNCQPCPLVLTELVPAPARPRTGRSRAALRRARACGDCTARYVPMVAIYPGTARTRDGRGRAVRAAEGPL